MKNLAIRLIRNPLISGSVVIFSGSIFANFFNFLFNLYMSRNLMVSDYGALISLISIITLLTIPANAVSPTIITTGGAFFASRNNKALKAFYLKILVPLMLLGGVNLVVFAIFSFQIGQFLKVNSPVMVILTGFAVILAYWSLLNNSFLQARLSFTALSVSNIMSAVFKVIAGILLVYFGLGLPGSVLAYAFSFLIAIVIGVFLMKKNLFVKGKSETTISYKDLLTYGIPSAIVVFCLNAYVSIDIILVKHFFTQDQAGLYAGLSLIGKVIFYIVAPIGMVMFPVIANKYNRQEKYKNTLILAIFLVGGCCISFSLFYLLFPQFTVLFFLKKKEYLEIGKYLFLFSIFISFYSVVSLLCYYYLSVKKVNIYLLTLAGVVMQIILLMLFHSNFYQVIFSSLVTMGCLLVLLLLALRKYHM